MLAKQPLGLEAQEDWLAAHVRLGEVFERLNRQADARKQYEKLLGLWKNGDQDLKLRAQATAGLARLNSRKSDKVTSIINITKGKGTEARLRVLFDGSQAFSIYSSPLFDEISTQ